MKKIKKNILKVIVSLAEKPVNIPEWPPESLVVFYEPKRVKKKSIKSLKM